MTNFTPLITKLECWTRAGSTFHHDRQLADEILLADGWRVQPDQGFEGGFKWSWGKNPEICASESYRPHPIDDLNTALGVVPFECCWAMATGDSGRCMAQVWTRGDKPMEHFVGWSETPAVAIVIAAMKWRQAHAV